MRILGIVLIGIAVSVAAMAADVKVPEVDPSSGVSALTLLSGALLIIRSHCKR